MRKYVLSRVLKRHEAFQEWTFFTLHSEERDGALDVDVALTQASPAALEVTVFPPNILHFPLYSSQ